MAAMINALNGTLPPALPGRATDTTVISAHNIHIDKDWSLARRCPVDASIATNTPNRLATKTKPKAPFHQGITTEDVNRIVNSRIQTLQQSTLNQSPASSSGQENITKADLQAVAKSLQETMS
ncbi:2582_t:CDS:2 [Dentiscutata heterogama]|uniref:2582_t:CDS:1 n=1 Tax=Dentiscutata heterogama TaxID=1316150 RepID=A0ACA9L4F9_9GLOM|nr:2582_t:CDS:2 [Dentiscutata heterogama]